MISVSRMINSIARVVLRANSSVASPANRRAPRGEATGDTPAHDEQSGRTPHHPRTVRRARYTTRRCGELHPTAQPPFVPVSLVAVLDPGPSQLLLFNRTPAL